MKSDTIETIIERYEKGFYQPHSEERRKEATAGSAELAAIHEENARLRGACRDALEWSKYVASSKRENTQEFLDGLFKEGEVVQKKLEAALSGEPSGKVLVDRESVNRLLEVIEARHGSNPEIVVMEMLAFARKYIPEHPQCQAHTLRDKMIADTKARFVVVDLEKLREIDFCLVACPFCKAGRGKAAGAIWEHAPDCWLATLLKDHTTVEEEPHE